MQIYRKISLAKINNNQINNGKTYLCVSICKVLRIIFILLLVALIKIKITEGKTMRGNQQSYILKREMHFVFKTRLYG